MTPPGATRAEWDHFSLILGLTEDLLPVVSNTDATISPLSKMKALGKTPSRYNSKREAAGIADWTQAKSTPNEIARWSAEPDYGICLQTRRVRALDCDINDPELAKEVHEAISAHAVAPERHRGNASKFLLAFILEGEYAKRTIKTRDGIIEFLATGQQFIAAGRHTSGARYEWRGGLPEDIPVISPALFEAIWSDLEARFAVEPSTTSSRTSRHDKITEAHTNDPVALSLVHQGLAISTERDGRIHILCPFSAEHTSDSAESATTYFPAFTGGFERGHFRCLHAHCEHRTDADFLAALGISTVEDDFDIVDPETAEAPSTTPSRYVFEAWEKSIDVPPPRFIVKGVLPEAALAVIFGESGSGKTFFALDLACAVARGVDWRGAKVKQGAVAYVAAEDVGGVRARVKAYVRHHDVQPGGMQLAILGDSPNLTKTDDTKELIKALSRFKEEVGHISLIFVDTLAQATSGADENSGEDMGKLLGHCRSLHRSTGATVVLIHHSGKDASKGARGHSSLRGASDAMVEVLNMDGDRVASIYKMKNAQDGAEFGFSLLPVLLGEDEDGEEVTSCVIQHTEAKPRAQRARREPKGVVEKIVVRVLGDLTIGGAVSTSDVVDAAVSHMPYDSAEGKRDKRREHVLRAINSLVERGAVVVSGNEISLAEGE